MSIPDPAELPKLHNGFAVKSKKWLREVKIRGQVKADTSVPLIFYTDASAPPGASVMAWVSTHGHYGVVSYRRKTKLDPGNRSVIAETRSIAFALATIEDPSKPPPDFPVYVLSDSRLAIRYVRGWSRGEEAYPRGYEIERPEGWRTPRLVVLAERVRRLTENGGLHIAHVTAHQGHLMNELVDSIAALGCRCHQGRVERSSLRGNIETKLLKALPHVDYAGDLGLFR